MNPRAANRPGFLQEAGRAWQEGRPWADLPGDALPFVLASTVGSGPLLVVVDEPDAADRLIEGLRFFLDTPERVERFPPDDVRPYDGFSPDPDVVGQRLRALYRWDRGDPLILVAPVRALLQRVPTAAERTAGTVSLEVGDVLPRETLAARLTATGYLAAAQAEHPGTFAVRGDVVDVWSVGLPAPRRVDFFDDEVEEIRVLDPRSLRPLRKGRRALMLPAREARIDDDTVRSFQVALGREMSAQGRGMKLRRRLVGELRAGIRFSALEDYLPALVDTETPLDALGSVRTLVVHPASVAASARDTWEHVHKRWQDLDEDERPLVTPDARFVDPASVLERLSGAHPVYEMAGVEGAASLGAQPVDGMAVRGTELGPVVNRLRELASKHVRVALVAPSAKRAQVLEDLVEPHGLVLRGRTSHHDMQPGEVSLLVGGLSRGFIARDSGWAFVPASALFGGRRTAAHRRAHDLFEAALGSVHDLKDGDLVVHRLHGIGRYEGLVRLDVSGAAQDFVRLAYRGDDVLYVPATDLGQLSAYTPSRAGVDVRLDRLGGQTWSTRKGKVRDQLLQSATELLAVQARREVAERMPHPPPGSLYKAFVARFPHTETPDQAAAIVDVQEDLSAEAPMDRLICGDVGFGKTEVAMRAAMRVVEGGQQVAVLCPTTVLAFQHQMKFVERFEGLPVRVGMLSRFTSADEARRIKQGLADGTVDIVIGTHALLSRHVRFAELGLLVVDEEHRFGVRQKERFKKLRAEVDVLALSATPIPRTLQLALSGVRQMSVMATPPEERLAVRTSVARFTETRVRDAIRLEMDRGGQVFFVHNRVESIDAIADRLRGWVPDVRFEVAHGQMDSEAIERLLVDFMARRFDVLVSTAIIESGVDLANVNTMIVDRADQFGLAQLYQLRGRVGRGAVRGNCLLLTPEDTTSQARKRLQVLVENTRLGSGFAVAAADLELRGGGNLLGKDQSGNIDAVGYTTWVELLEEAVHAARGEVDRARLEPEIEVPVPAFLPEQLLPDVHERLTWYRRFSGVEHPEALDGLLDELEHERGSLPDEVHHLAGRVDTTLRARALGIRRIAWLQVRVVLELDPTTPITRAMLDEVVAEHPKRTAVEAGPGDSPAVLSVRFTPREATRPFRFLQWLLARLGRAVRDAG